MNITEFSLLIFSCLIFLGVFIFFIRELAIAWKAKQPKPKITITSGLGPPPQGGSGVKDSHRELTIRVFIEKEKNDEAKN